MNTQVSLIRRSSEVKTRCLKSQSSSDVKTRYMKPSQKIDKLFEEHHSRGYQSFSVFLENELLKKKRFHLQSVDDLMGGISAMREQLEFVKRHMSSILGNDSGELEWWSHKLESLMMTYYWSQKCETGADYIMLVQTSYKLMTGRSAGVYLCETLAAMFGDVQSDRIEEALGAMRKAFDTVEGACEHPLVKKITGLYSHLLVQGFLAKFGLEMTSEEYSGLERKAMRAQYSSTKGLWMNVMDVALFVCERLNEWRKTGEVSSVLHTGDAYQKWMKTADNLIALAPFTSNLEAHNTTYFSFVSDLANAVEQGEAYSRFSSKTFGGSVDVIKRKLMALQLIKNTEVTKRASQKERKAPFGVLVHGSSSVAKSTFTKMLFYYYGQLHGLDTDDHYRYVRSPADEYWSNFDSSKWCIQLDDIAFLLPDKSSDVDPTLKEMLNVVNNVPYVPPQAAIEDKGKTPVLAKLVVATTNAPDLNARAYFWCPLAVRRRLPYVVQVVPKTEYLASNRKFIDPSKLPTLSTEYPDFWEITVQRVVPTTDGQRDIATLEDVKKYSDVRLFLQDFGKMSLLHEQTQCKAMNADEVMRHFTVCKVCCAPKDVCACLGLQFGEEFHTEWEFPAWEFTQRCQTNIWQWLVDICTQVIKRLISWGAELQLALWLTGLALRYEFIRRCYRRVILPLLTERVQMRIVGYANEEVMGTKRWKLALAGFAGVAAGYALYTKCRSKPLSTQGNMYGTTEKQMAKEETSNVWYNPTLELSKFDVPVASRSLATVSKDELERIFGNNCVKLKVRTQVAGVWSTRTNGGVMLKGHVCLTNNHTFRVDADIYEVTLITMTVSQGITSNMSFVLRTNDLVRDPNVDACVFEVRSVPPFKDITKFWDFSGAKAFTKAVVVRRSELGVVNAQDVFALSHYDDFRVDDLGLNMPISIGKCSNITAQGDCGGIYVATTPKGPIIFGLHILGRGTDCGVVRISNADVQSLERRLSSKLVSAAVVQAGDGPQLDLVNKKNPLSEPHHRSMMRYIQEGTLRVYGSFAGFRAKPRSRVSSTPLREVMMEHFDYEINHGAPVMDGWEPWRKNLVEMVKPNVTYQRDILDHCVESYINDILTRLPDDWAKELCFLSREASVNGLPGVKFVDRLNVNSSMGFPWAETKKNHLHANISETYPEGVDFSDEVWERVSKIEEKYAQGERCYPVFTGHLKDEPVTFAKIAAQKTRVFTGAPVDWSLVVRSRLLSFVRLLQKEKFIFEAGPGTVCQSAEWGRIREYLVAHGDDRIIAGDYGKFDKRMAADFILAAYRIIGEIYRAAGFTDEEVREIACIGEDTAFPLVNFNGDLVEFFGTNPSGHPLTVVINSLVNSLYMRYCYVVLNPVHECVTFKRNVNLFTYGDDNIMGVSQACDWFNHTGIQAVLANIGVEYTMADKESESVPFVCLGDVQFLKRSWRYDEDVGEYLCPLEWESIMKSLTTWVPSGTIDPYDQMVAVISSANSEFFFWGRDVFEKHHNFFARILREEPYSHYVKTGTLPGWEQLVDRFHRSG